MGLWIAYLPSTFLYKVRGSAFAKLELRYQFAMIIWQNQISSDSFLSFYWLNVQIYFYLKFFNLFLVKV